MNVRRIRCDPCCAELATTRVAGRWAAWWELAHLRFEQRHARCGHPEAVARELVDSRTGDRS